MNGFDASIEKLKSGSHTARWAARKILAQKEELDYWVSQYGCDCGHPRCTKCKDTKND